MFKSAVEVNSYENNLIRQGLESNGLRLDGRLIDYFRPIEANISRKENYCSAHVTLEKTSCICVVQGYVVSPYEDRSSEGIIHINTELSAYAEQFSTISNHELRRIIERSIRESEAIDTESLCIISGEYVWRIVCDLKVIDCSSGNIIDCAIFAVMASLRGFRKSEVTVSMSGTGTSSYAQIHVHSSVEREPLPLALHHTPLAATIALFGIEKSSNSSDDKKSSNLIISNPNRNASIILVCDPSIEEESCMDGKIIVSMTAHRELCALYKPGGLALPREVILIATQTAGTRIQYLHRVLQQSLNDLETRDYKEKEARVNQINNKSENMLDSNMIGISRDDPMLAWTNLHKPASLLS